MSRLEIAMSMSALFVAIPLSGIVLTLIILLVWYAKNKQQQVQQRIRDLADELGAHIVEESGWQTGHQLLLDHDGLRSRIRIQDNAEYNQHSGLYPVGQGTRLLSVVTDGFHPGFELKISPNSLSQRLNAWFQGQSCKSSYAEINDDFVISANQYHNKIDEILSPEIVSLITTLNQFSLPMHKAELKERAQPPIKQQPQSTTTATCANDTFGLTALLNRKRFLLGLKAGECHCHLLIHESEDPQLGSLVRSMLEIQTGLADGIVLANKTAAKI